MNVIQMHFFFFFFATFPLYILYYNNEKNEGHIFIKVQNEGENKISFKKGDRIAQGIFQKYYIVDNDEVEETRQGGVGSTNKGDEIYE